MQLVLETNHDMAMNMTIFLSAILNNQILALQILARIFLYSLERNMIQKVFYCICVRVALWGCLFQQQIFKKRVENEKIYQKKKILPSVGLCSSGLNEAIKSRSKICARMFKGLQLQRYSIKQIQSLKINLIVILSLYRKVRNYFSAVNLEKTILSLEFLLFFLAIICQFA